jgi:hypothetical protein
LLTYQTGKRSAVARRDKPPLAKYYKYYKCCFERFLFSRDLLKAFRFQHQTGTWSPAFSLPAPSCLHCCREAFGGISIAHCGRRLAFFARRLMILRPGLPDGDLVKPRKNGLREAVGGRCIRGRRDLTGS